MKYQLFPFEFKRFSGEVLLTSECGDFAFLGEKEFDALRHGNANLLSTATKHELESKNFIATPENVPLAIELSALRYRNRKEFLRNFTSLHMLVVTLCCNHKCTYCQVSSADEDAKKYDMPEDVARKATDVIFQSPSKAITIEFQGGDASLNLRAIKACVERAEELNSGDHKNISFVACTNLYAVSDGFLEYAKQHKISISTSLDGPKDLHDANRPTRSGASSYDKFVSQLEKARAVLGFDQVAALMTASRASLPRITEIIDEYVKLGFPGIFFRSLNPYGEAYLSNLFYTPELFLTMFVSGLEYIIALNKKGIKFREFYTALLIRRILSSFPTGFVDLQSPSGAGINGAIYDYDGNVYPADEARMLARMGDRKFCMGNVFANTYEEIFNGKVLRSITKESCIETVPCCSPCAYRVYCGVDVFRNYQETGKISGVSRQSFFCRKQMGIFDYLFHKIRTDREFLGIVAQWIG